MTEPNAAPSPQGPKGPNVSEFADALMGWQATFFRTISASLTHPERVARAALESDVSQYASPLRLFIFLFGGLLAVTALISPEPVTNIQNFLGLPAAVVEAWLAENHTVTLDEVNAGWQSWLNILVWPMTLIGSTPYILLLKAYDLSRTLYGAALVYLVTTNGMMALQIILQLVLTPLVSIELNMLISTVAVILVYLYISARVIVVLYARTLTGRILKVLAMVALTPVALIITAMLQFLALGLVLNFGFDISVMDIMEYATGEAAS